MDFPFFLALQWRERYGRIGEGGGPVRFSFAFFSLLSVLLAVGCLRYEFLCYIFSVGSFVVFFRGFLFYKSLIVNNLLQVVSPKSEP
jgi:hypothetical protein